MFCSSCGAQNNDGAKFCSNCGKSMTGSGTAGINTYVSIFCRVLHVFANIATLVSLFFPFITVYVLFEWEDYYLMDINEEIFYVAVGSVVVALLFCFHHS